MIGRQKEEKPQSKFSAVIWKVLSYSIFILPALLAFSLQRVFVLFPSFVENIYSTKVFRFLSIPISFITSLLPFSLTEISLYLSVPLLVVLVILLVRQMKKSKNRKKSALLDCKRIGWTLSILYLVFMLLHGFNYTRAPLGVTLGITTSPRSSEDLEAVCYILLEQTNSAREGCKEVDGVMVLENGIDNALKTAYKGYQAISEVYPVLAITPRKGKGVIASHLWSYTWITGMYFPFYVEANVNIDAPQMSLPNTILHELAHTIGIAREDEANFAAFITGIHHYDRDFKYSSYLFAFIESASALHSTDPEAFTALMAQASDGVKRDLGAYNAYWQQFEGRVQEISSSVNNAYLQSNLQEDGVKSYGRVVDLIIGYYLS